MISATSSPTLRTAVPQQNPRNPAYDTWGRRRRRRRDVRERVRGETPRRAARARAVVSEGGGARRRTHLLQQRGEEVGDQVDVIVGVGAAGPARGLLLRVAVLRHRRELRGAE